MKKLIWLWVFLGVQGTLGTGLWLAFLFLEPLRAVTEDLVCAPDEHLVTEKQVVRGTHASETTRDCCAKASDTRAFGKCANRRSQHPVSRVNSPAQRSASLRGAGVLLASRELDEKG